MFFPTLEQIATRVVVSIDASATVAEAVALMLEHDIRDIVVKGGEDGCNYGIFTVNGLIGCCTDELERTLTLHEAGIVELPCAPKSANVLEVFPSLDQREDYLGVLDDDGSLWGIVSYTDLVTNIDPEVLIEKQCVGELFEKVIVKTAMPSQPLRDVLRQLNNVDDAVIVVDEGRPQGIVTTKDAIHLFDTCRNLDEPVERYMSSPVQTIRKDVTIKQALDFIRAHHYKRIVVEEDGRLVGVITQRELVSMAYNRWVALLRSHTEQLQEVVDLLREKASKLEVLATTDSLTGLANRAKLQNCLNQEVIRARRYHSARFSIVLVDVDRFKQINDDFGHLVGDQVLRELAKLLEEQVRETDFVARWGGEEFMLLLPMTALENAAAFAERLRDRVSTIALPIKRPLTISLGVAHYREDETLDQLFQRVDQALYRAKDEGRNRVVVAE